MLQKCLNPNALTQDFAVDGLDDAQAELTTQVDGTIEQVRVLQDANQDMRAELQRDTQAGGRRRGRRRRRKGGYTPTPCHKRCCGTGTRLNKKKTKCVARRSNRRSRRRRRRR